MTDETGKHVSEEKTARKPWTDREFGGKPLWDWLQLLIVPLVIAAIGFWFTASQNNRQQEIENARAQQAQKIEDKRAKAERALAKQSAQDEALQAYLDQMSSLMLEKNLLESERGDSVYTLAQARTATVMTRLDSGRNKTVLSFLWNSGLLGKSSSGESSVNLFRNIDLRGADLRGRSMPEAPLRGAVLDHADLRGAMLAHADLRGAYLDSTNLNDAIMSHVDLSNATLFGADLKRTQLNDADLSNAALTSSASLAKFTSAANVQEVGGTPLQELLSSKALVGAHQKDAADLSGADLSGSDLRDAYLGKADLSDADLTEADLSRSVLINADLSDTDLSNADLSPAYLAGVSGITPEQLDQQAKSLRGAVLPGGEFAADEFKPKVSLRLSDGWAVANEATDKLYLQFLGSSLRGPSQGELDISSHIDHVFDPSNPSEQTEVSAPENVDEWVSWFRQNPNLETSKPVSVRVGGATGMRIDATLSSELEDYSQDLCGKDPCVPLYSGIIRSWKGYKDRFIILDVKGDTVIIDVSAASAENKFDEFLPKAQKVLDTIDIQPQDERSDQARNDPSPSRVAKVENKRSDQARNNSSSSGAAEEKTPTFTLDRALSGHSDSVNSVAFSPEGELLASSSPDGTIKVWDSQSGEELQTLSGHSELINSVAFGPVGELLAGGSHADTVKVWDPQSGEELQTLSGHSGRVNSVAFSPDGKLLASSSHDGTIKVWDPQSGEELRTLSGHSNSVKTIAFSPDGKLLASGSYDETVKVWDPQSGEELQTLSGHSDDSVTAGGRVTAVAFSPDGELLASGSWDETIKLWDPQSGEELQTLSGHSDRVTAVAFSPDGELLASGSHDETVKVWDPQSGEELQTLRGHSGSVLTVAFGPGGKLLASGSGDGTIKLWERAEAQQ